jgi:hypothetical protein
MMACSPAAVSAAESLAATRRIIACSNSTGRFRSPVLGDVPDRSRAAPRAAEDNKVFCEDLPGLIGIPVASVRSLRFSGGSDVAVVEVEVEVKKWATAEDVASGTTAGGGGLAEEIRVIGYRFLTVQLTAGTQTPAA